MEWTQLKGKAWKNWKKCELGTVVVKVRVNPEAKNWSAYCHGQTGNVTEEHDIPSEALAFKRADELALAMLHSDLEQIEKELHGFNSPEATGQCCTQTAE